MINYVQRDRYVYKIFGLVVVSDFRFENLVSLPNSENFSDIEIIKGTIPVNHFDTSQESIFLKMTRSEYAFHIKDTGAFYVANGNIIVVEPYPYSDYSKMKLFILGSCFGYILMQRGILAIHGSAVVINDVCIILSGASGVGKSTLTSAFIKKGYQFLTDDVAAICFDDNNNIVVEPSYPQLKLCSDTLKNSGEESTGLAKISLCGEKYLKPVQGAFFNKSVKLKAFFEIKTHTQDRVILQDISGGEKHQVILKNTYRLEFLKKVKFEEQHFIKCSLVAKKVDIFKIFRPQNKFSTDEQIERILEKINR